MAADKNKVKIFERETPCSNDPVFHSPMARRIHIRQGCPPATANALADAFLLGKGGRHECS